MTRRKTNEEVIAEFKKIHKNKYNYELVKYVSTHKKVKIVCRVHGVFEQKPSAHLRGNGCPDCAGRYTYNNSKIINLFKEVHGDKYNYDLVEYQNSYSKIKIVCKKHGPFEQSPSSHRQGIGCPECGGRFRYDNERIIKKFQEIHGAKYDYKNVVYKKSIAKVTIICPLHGEFQMSPNNHLRGKGCPKCKNEKIAKSKLKSKEYVIEQFKKTHGNRYDYSKVAYKDSKTKVKIICKSHGEFEQQPSNHANGSGCPICAGVIKHDNQSIINFFKKKHGNRYDYSQVDYTNHSNKVIITCKIHGNFYQTPTKHLSGQGCPHCANKFLYNTEKIKEKFRQVHGDLYNYDSVEYKNTHTKVNIKCPIHGSFAQTPSNHLQGYGCSMCKGSKIITSENILDLFKEKHGNLYDYSFVNYVNSRTHIKIICPSHGLFEQSAYVHLKGSGCPICANDKRRDFFSKNQEDAINDFINVHGNKYDYKNVKYINAFTKVIIGCKIHGDFEQTPTKHLFGQGCPLCNQGWTSKSILDFINSIENLDLLHMDSIELQTIINQGKLPDALNVLVFSDQSYRDNTIKALKESLQNEIDSVQFMPEIDLTENESNLNEELQQDAVEDADLLLNDIKKTYESKENLISLSEIIDDLHVIDKPLVASCDEEAMNFLIQYKLRKLWNNVLNNSVDIELLRNEKGGANFELLKSHFFEEYNQVIAYKPPKGYGFPHPLNAMQQLTVFRMLKNKCYGNWSGTGAGKTISFIVASREVKSRVTVLIGLNSTIKQLADSILEVYPDSKVFTKYTKGQIFNKKDFNYLILNYDKFQQGYSEELFQSLTDNNTIDFVAIDEVHNVKQRTEEQESIRRGTLKRLIGRAREKNPDLYVLGMSATPVINNLKEAKSLLEMITGKEYEDLNTTRTLTNAMEVFKQMTLNGLRYIPKYQIKVKELDSTNTPLLKIAGENLLDKLLKVGNQNYLNAERILLTEKLKAIQHFLNKGTLIYSYFTTKMIEPIANHLTSLGFRVGTFTGDEPMDKREYNKENFIKGKLDILIGSKPIGTGVDGLQKVCKRMIILSLPWTDSEYTQLIGRIYRQGSSFDKVEVIIPQVIINLGDKEWSWDLQRMNLIKNKKTLADAAVDGVIPSKSLPRPETLFAKSIEALKEWKNRLNAGNVFRIDRKNLTFPLRPDIVEQIGRKLGDFSEVNRVWSVSKSSTTHERLKHNPEEWYYYHTLYREKRETWDEIPYKEIAKMIKRKDFVVADLGCGESLLKKELPHNKVLAFDHVAVDETVTACDMCNVPLEDESIDVAVFSLSLMGSNYHDYIKEAHRILKTMGFLFIAEPLNKWDNTLDKLQNELEEIGFTDLIINKSKNFIYIKCEKK